MFKFKKPVWIVLAVFGALALLGSVAAMIWRIASGCWSWIPGTVLLLSAVGGGFLAFFALRSLKLLPEIAAAQSVKARKERQAAESVLVQSTPVVEKRFSRCLSLLILLLCALAFLSAYRKANGTGYVLTNRSTGGESEKATVISIDAESYHGDQTMEDRIIGSQTVTVEMLSGEFKGKRFQLQNELSTWYGTLLKEGDPVIVGYTTENGEISGNMVISDYDRTVPLLIVIGLFMLITVLVGGKIGLKSILGLVLTFVCIFTLMIPQLLSGSDTLTTVFGMCALVTVVEFVVLDGANKKTFCAILGTLAGVLLAAVFAKVSEALLRVDGYNMKTVDSMIEDLGSHRLWQQMINGNVFASLQISDLLVGGILIAALGAVNDVAMSISSAMNELITVNPELTRKDLFRSGMNIGRDMVGTMTNTLILAVAGNGLVLMIFYTIMEPTWYMIIDSSFLPIEVLQALASSAGVILAVPLTVVIGMFLYGHSAKKNAKKAKRTAA